MRSRSRTSIILVVACVIGLAGCGHTDEVLIDPAPVERDRTDLGLGPGVRAMTAGPGDKGSPSYGPDDERLAFVMDGYVVEKDLSAGTLERRTTKDFGAGAVDWGHYGEKLTVTVPEGEEETFALYRTQSDGSGDMGVTLISEGVLAAARVPGGSDLLAAFAGETQSTLARLKEDGEVSRLYTRKLDGSATGVSLSPNGHQALISTREDGFFSLYVVDLLEDSVRQVARTEEGKEVLGAPQWTREGLYYVAGENAASEETPVYELYRLPADAGANTRAEIVSDIGEDFIPSNIRVSPEGNRLAVLGRRSLNSPANLYVLDLESGDLQTATSNENMEIKTGPGDLTWSTGGQSVVLVARAMSAEIEVQATPADKITADFYNVYEVPVEDLGD
ncbi:MAG: hypothetical protein H0W54_04325 [Rubrobacter sp.]|nr:hypothetical protein [Rubrobacter sp.]